jgi:single-stranded-DNA-specific exonuclease
LNNLKEYIIKPKIRGTEAVTCRELACDLEIPLILAELLYQRGYVTADAAKTFLGPKLADLPSPFGLKGMRTAVELILETIVSRRQVVIHGDYDVDGITATVLLVDFLNKFDLEVIYHLPNRMTEGYGLSMNSVAQLAEKVTMPALFITVDCGISATKEIRYAVELGFKVIVTDHHEPSNELPPAQAIINPKQPDCKFKCKELSGVGVAFFLAMAVRRKMVEQGFWDRDNVPNLKNYLDFVALGTVADVMELVDTNRILVKAGLEVITARNKPGIWALCERAGIGEGVVTAEDISFRLAPRINAAGRLGKPQLAADLLLSREVDEAQDLAIALEQANEKRRELEKTALDDAMKQAGQQVDSNRKGLVLFGSNWHPGVVGIIAARVVDRFRLPVLVFTRDTASDSKTLKASGRSVPELNLFQVLQQCNNFIVQFGGHPMAAGLTVVSEDFSQFSEEFNNCVCRMMQGSEPEGVVIDMIVNVEDNCEEMAHSLKLMEPFGQGNPEPVFLLKNIRMQKVTRLRDHLKFSLLINGSPIHGIGFFKATLFEVASRPVDLGFKLKQTTFRGRERIEAHAVAIKPTS